MRMQRDEFDQLFVEYRENLRNEIHCFRDSFCTLKLIRDCTKSYLSEINLAPAFFHTIEKSLYATTILWADKLLDNEGKRGFFNFLNLIEYNLKWLIPEELKRRKSLVDDHWMLNERVQINIKLINSDRLRINSLPLLSNIQTHRDKYVAHFDKKYFFNLEKLNSEAGITWDELEHAAHVMGDILNTYSVEFDGMCYSWKEPDDLINLLQSTRK